MSASSSAVNPTSTGSSSSQPRIGPHLTAHFSREAKSCEAVAPPRLTMASAWRVEIPTGPSAAPLANPACSMSHAAESLTFSPAGNRGTGGPRACSSRCYLVGPAGSARIDEERTGAAGVGICGSITIDFERRRVRTASRTAASEGRSAPPRSELARELRVATTFAPPSRRKESVTESTTYWSFRCALNALCR